MFTPPSFAWTRASISDITCCCLACKMSIHLTKMSNVYTFCLYIWQMSNVLTFCLYILSIHSVYTLDKSSYVYTAESAPPVGSEWDPMWPHLGPMGSLWGAMGPHWGPMGPRWDPMGPARVLWGRTGAPVYPKDTLHDDGGEDVVRFRAKWYQMTVLLVCQCPHSCPPPRPL